MGRTRSQRSTPETPGGGTPPSKRSRQIPDAGRDAGPAREISAAAALTDDAWHVIASFAAPPDVYSLALTTRHFHRDGATGQGESPEARPARLATRLLRSSLLSNLDMVLRHSASPMELRDVLSLPELPQGSVLLTGSTMVQTCVGKLWEGNYSTPLDVDLFCTAAAAPAVRSWLVNQVEAGFVGFNDTYDGVEDVTHPIDSKIHHVEYYGDLKSDFGFGRASYEEACQFGKAVNENYVQWKWNNVLKPSGIDDIGPDYRIEPLEGDNFPFDYTECKSIDLVVAKKECPSALELLDDFDLNICKASFDGRVFRIPDPHLTFTGRSRMEPNRKALMASYVSNYMLGFRINGTDAETLHGQDKLIHICRTCASVRSDHPELPFYRLLIHLLAAEVTDGAIQTQLTLQFHNFVDKLVARLKKYLSRGINVVDAPDGALDFHIGHVELFEVFHYF